MLPTPLVTFPKKMCNTFSSFNRFIFLNVYIPIIESFFCLIPTACITTFLYFARCNLFFVDGCLWWILYIKIWWHLLSHNERSIFDILIDPNPNAQPKYTPQVLWVCVKRHSTVISEIFHGSGQKDKYYPWYLK